MCVAVNEGRAIDLIEIDAASNRRIADVRDLTEKIHYSPAEAKFKVYIIDEVHMLTQEAFNALLKTLEEPPPHAILILATTDVHKVPLTIISRCQRFDFRRVPAEDIVSKLKKLSVEEEIDIDDEVLTLVARKSTGSLRDAENILEQVMVSVEQPVTEEAVRKLLNLTDESLPADLLEAMADNDIKDSLVKLGNLVADGMEPSQVHSSLMEITRVMILLKSRASDGSEFGDSLKERLVEIVEKFSIERLVYIAKIMAEVDFKDLLNPALSLEIAVMESILGAQDNTSSQIVAATKTVTSSPTVAQSKPFPNTTPADPVNKKPQDLNKTGPVTEKTIPEPVVASATSEKPSDQVQEMATDTIVTAPPTTAVGESTIDEHWNELLRSLRQTGKRFNLGALLRGCKERELKGDTLVLTFLHSSHLDRINSEIEDPLVNGQFESVVEKVLGKKYKISVELANNELKSVPGPISQQSPLVRAAQALGARIVEERSKG